MAYDELLKGTERDDPLRPLVGEQDGIKASTFLALLAI